MLFFPQPQTPKLLITYISKLTMRQFFFKNLTWICFVLTQFLNWGSGLLFDAVFCGLFWLNFDSVLNSVWVCFGAILVKILILCWLNLLHFCFVLTQYQLSSNSVSTRGYCQFSHSIYFDSIWNKFQRLFQSISISA